MEFNVTLVKKTSEGQDTTLKFEPVNREVCDCDAIIVKVPITAQGYFIDSVYTVTISEYVEPSEPAV